MRQLVFANASNALMVHTQCCLQITPYLPLPVSIPHHAYTHSERLNSIYYVYSYIDPKRMNG